MPQWLVPYMMCFVPLFVAIDPVSLAPFYLAAVEHRKPAAQRRVLIYAIATAGIVGVAFLLVGEVVLRLVGVTLPDFMIAGGVMLLVIAVVDIVMADKAQFRSGTRPDDDDAPQYGAVPLGMPLILGPATVTTLISHSGTYGLLPVLSMFALVIAITAVVFWQSPLVMRLLGKAGASAVGKVVSLMLAAFAIKMIRTGVEAAIATRAF
jgi:multiple antibiotic resistance protein